MMLSGISCDWAHLHVSPSILWKGIYIYIYICFFRAFFAPFMRLFSAPFLGSRGIKKSLLSSTRLAARGFGLQRRAEAAEAPCTKGKAHSGCITGWLAVRKCCCLGGGNALQKLEGQRLLHQPTNSLSLKAGHKHSASVRGQGEGGICYQSGAM